MGPDAARDQGIHLRKEAGNLIRRGFIHHACRAVGDLIVRSLSHHPLEVAFTEFLDCIGVVVGPQVASLQPREVQVSQGLQNQAEPIGGTSRMAEPTSCCPVRHFLNGDVPWHLPSRRPMFKAVRYPNRECFYGYPGDFTRSDRSGRRQTDSPTWNSGIEPVSMRPHPDRPSRRGRDEMVNGDTGTATHGRCPDGDYIAAHGERPDRAADENRRASRIRRPAVGARLQ
jgi:hypothetical protein